MAGQFGSQGVRALFDAIGRAFYSRSIFNGIIRCSINT